MLVLQRLQSISKGAASWAQGGAAEATQGWNTILCQQALPALGLKKDAMFGFLYTAAVSAPAYFMLLHARAASADRAASASGLLMGHCCCPCVLLPRLHKARARQRQCARLQHLWVHPAHAWECSHYLIAGVTGCHCSSWPLNGSQRACSVLLATHLPTWTCWRLMHMVAGESC